MQPTLTKTNFYPALTGIRTVASCMVFLHHFNPFKAVWFGNFMHDFIGEFHVGVTIFFVLSGFLICYKYYDSVVSFKTGIRPYLINRIARIYPMYFIITIISFLPFVCNCVFSKNIPVLFLNLTFLRGFFDEYKFTGIPGGWSLTVEEMFYFLFPILILASRKIKLIFQPLLIIGAGLTLWMIFRNTSFHGFFSTPAFVFEFTFFGRCFEFFAGMYLAILFRSKYSNSVERAGSVRTLIGISYIIACICLLVVNRWYSPQDSGCFLFFETLINNFILPVGICILFLGILTERSFVKNILGSSPFVLLGKSSYIFYLIHNGFLFSFFYLTLHLNLPVIFILLQVIAILLFYIAENPLNKLIRKIAWAD